VRRAHRQQAHYNKVLISVIASNIDAAEPPKPKHWLMCMLNPFRKKNTAAPNKPRTWWGTGLSLLAHGTIVALLWAVPSIEINPPEVPPPESIDATILPPPPPEKTETVKNTNIANPPSKPSDTPAKSTPTPSQASKVPEAGDGIAKQGSADNQTNKPENVGDKKPLPSGTPFAVKPSGGFDIKYNVEATQLGKPPTVFGKEVGSLAHAEGSGSLSFRRSSNNTFVANLQAGASIGFGKAKLNATSEGEIREKTLATKKFNYVIDITAMSQKSASFTVNYDAKQAVFTKGSDPSQTRDLSQDTLFDFMSVIAYLQSGFQGNAIPKSPNNFELSLGKRDVIENVTISVASVDTLQTADYSGAAIPVNIAINSKDIKSVRVWFAQDANYQPLKIEIVVDKYKVSMLSSKHS
jgi:hypothetical protein